MAPLVSIETVTAPVKEPLEMVNTLFPVKSGSPVAQIVAYSIDANDGGLRGDGSDAQPRERKESKALVTEPGTPYQ